MRWPGFIGPSYVSQALTADQEETYNFYYEKLQSQGATQALALYPLPGVEEIGNLDTAGAGRAHYWDASTGREFAVIGSAFVEVDRSGAMTSRGTVAVDGNPATISSNGAGGSQLFITSGTNGYTFTLTTNVLAQVTAINGLCTMGIFLDSYFVILDGATGTMYASDLLDGSSWDLTNGQQRSLAPDPWISMQVSGRYIWLFGSKTSEVWYNAGTSPFPFAPASSGLVQYGIGAQFSALPSVNNLFWLGSTGIGNGMVLHANGLAAEDVSTLAVQAAINGYSNISDAVGDTYDDLGHSFYLLSFPSQGVTWCLDTDSGLWTKRATWISGEARWSTWRPRFHALAFGEHRMLDGESSAIYRMSSTILTDVEGRPLRRMRRAPAANQENQRLFYSSFELDLEQGIGTSTGQGENPQVMLRYSNDGGRTWGPELWRSAGKIGETKTRVQWKRMGSARKRVFEVSMSDPVNWRLTNAYVQSSQTPNGPPQEEGQQGG
jgi:hypothetical protein